VLADEVQTFKALITIHKVLQEGHPMVVREAQQHSNWIDSLMRGVGGDGVRGMISALGNCAMVLGWRCCNADGKQDIDGFG
jgi:hypothetical protein